jgi:hypothetical protein
MKAVRWFVISLAVAVLESHFGALADDSRWERIDLYEKGVAAYQKSDWHTAVENLSAFQKINEERFKTIAAKAVADFKKDLGDAIENCFYNLAAQPSGTVTRNELDIAGGGSTQPKKRSANPDVTLPANPPP